MAVQLVAVVVDVAGRIRPCGGASHFWNLYLQTNADLLLWRPNSQTGVAVCWTLCAAAVGNRVQVLRVATSGVGGGVCRDHVIADVALEIHVASFLHSGLSVARSCFYVVRIRGQESRLCWKRCLLSQGPPRTLKPT